MERERFELDLDPGLVEEVEERGEELSGLLNELLGEYLYGGSARVEEVEDRVERLRRDNRRMEGRLSKLEERVELLREGREGKGEAEEEGERGPSEAAEEEGEEGGVSEEKGERMKAVFEALSVAENQVSKAGHEHKPGAQRKAERAIQVQADVVGVSQDSLTEAAKTANRGDVEGAIDSLSGEISDLEEGDLDRVVRETLEPSEEKPWE